MSVTFDCPSCGAPLEANASGESAIRCQYCGKSVIVPQELRSKPFIEGFPPFSSSISLGMDLQSLVGQAAAFKEVMTLVQAGKKIEAIKRYRELTGLGLRESKDAVDKLERGETVEITSFTGQSGESAFPGTSAQVGMLPGGTASPQTTVIDARQAQALASRFARWIGLLLVIVVLCTVGMVILLGLATSFAPLAALFASSDPGRIVSQLKPEAFASPTLSFGGEGTGAGLFTDARSLAVDNVTGNIYVGEYQGGRIQAFDSSGKFLTQWSVGDRKTIILSLAADRKGVVYVVAGGDIYLYEGASGNLLGTTKVSGDFDYIDNLTLTAGGEMVAIGRGENILWFNRNLEVVQTLPAAISSVSGDSELDTALAVDGLGNVYALGTFNNAVFVFTPQGKFVTRFGSDGDEPGQFRATSAIAVDNQSRVYVSDIKGIQVFEANGRYLETIKVSGVAFGMIFNDKNELFTIGTDDMVTRYQITK